MKAKQTRLWVSVMTGVTLFGLAIAAPRAGQHGFGPKGPGRLLPPARVLERIGLDEAQIAEARQLREDHKATV